MSAALQQVPTFGSLLQAFFCEHLIGQRDVSGATVASYRDTFRLLLGYAHQQLHRLPTDLCLADIDVQFVTRFLSHLERDRGNSARTRNARLAAIRSFMKFASTKCPTALPTVQRVRAIPMKRFNRPLLGFLSREEMAAIIAAPDRSTRSGRRDHAMLTMFYNTGARVSEMTRLLVADITVNGIPACASTARGVRREQSLSGRRHAVCSARGSERATWRPRRRFSRTATEGRCHALVSRIAWPLRRPALPSPAHR